MGQVTFWGMKRQSVIQKLNYCFYIAEKQENFCVGNWLVAEEFTDRLSVVLSASSCLRSGHHGWLYSLSKGEAMRAA